MPRYWVLKRFLLSVTVVLFFSQSSPAQEESRAETSPPANSSQQAPQSPVPMYEPSPEMLDTVPPGYSPYPYQYSPTASPSGNGYVSNVPGYYSEPPADWYQRDWRYRMRNYRGSRFSRENYSGYKPRYYYYSPQTYERTTRWHYPVDPYPYYDQPRRAFDEGYWQGRRDGVRISDYEQRQRAGVTSYLSGTRLGIDAFLRGDYSTASKQFNLAARVNQGDAAVRLHLAHSLTALGRYEDATLAVRRAIQLQTRLVYLLLDIREDYGSPEDFEKHYNLLRKKTEEAVDDGNLWFLLAYYQFFSGRELEALGSIEKANILIPKDRVILRLYDAVKLSTPASEEFHMDPPAPPAAPYHQEPPAPGSTARSQAT